MKVLKTVIDLVLVWQTSILMKNVRPRCYESEYCVINTHSKELLKNHLNKQIDDHER